MTVSDLREALAAMPVHAVVHVHIYGDALCEGCYETHAGWSLVAGVTLDNIGGTIVSIECEECDDR